MTDTLREEESEQEGRLRRRRHSDVIRVISAWPAFETGGVEFERCGSFPGRKSIPKTGYLLYYGTFRLVCIFGALTHTRD